MDIETIVQCLKLTLAALEVCWWLYQKTASASLEMRESHL